MKKNLKIHFSTDIHPIVPTYLRKIPSKTSSGFLKPQMLLNPIYTMFCPICNL